MGGNRFGAWSSPHGTCRALQELKRAEELSKARIYADACVQRGPEFW
jgi:hypothetical protein